MPGSSAMTASDPDPSSTPGMVSQNSTSTMEPPYFVIYAIDNSEDPNVQGPPPVENLTVSVTSPPTSLSNRSCRQGFNVVYVYSYFILGSI
jgi:hypothetical protein